MVGPTIYTVFAPTFNGEATSALYAERYGADAKYPEGNILVIGGDTEGLIEVMVRSD